MTAMLDKITVCLDMHGCPNRCRHCWLGNTPNGHMNVDDLCDVAARFRPHTACLTVYDWYREPDYSDDYRERWELCGRLSDTREEHFELVSVWRAVRDDSYIDWLKRLGMKRAQLTLFGGQETTDYFTGRRGAYDEILRTIELLIESRISPRIQVFVYKDNINELNSIVELITTLNLVERCRDFGGEFGCFVHQGSCDGENERQYDSWVTPAELSLIPPMLTEFTLKHFGKSSLDEVFGETEQSLYERLSADESTVSCVVDEPVFYIDREFDVYPNLSTPSPQWRLGNLKRDGAEKILDCYLNSRSLAQHIRLNTPTRELVLSQGDPTSRRLFWQGDYIELMLNRYCRALMN